jgi:hypothetical protein
LETCKRYEYSVNSTCKISRSFFLPIEPEFREKMAEKAQAKIEETEVIIGPDGTKQVVPKEHVYKYDMMISYCHADKELVYQVQKFLSDEGFNIWFDRDNMYGPGRSILSISFTF